MLSRSTETAGAVEAWFWDLFVDFFFTTGILTLLGVFMEQQNFRDTRTAIVILGASGDLTQRKLIPALRRLYSMGGLPREFVIYGTGRRSFGHEEFRRHLGLEQEGSEDFASRIFYHQGFSGLKEAVESRGEWAQSICFLALPPQAYAGGAEALYREGFRENTRLIIEKPFGYDAGSAHELNENLHRYYSEEALFRIDHYLAKEPVQNILAFRFANSLFEPLWNKDYVESFQINAEETLGVGNRGPYFDQAGIVRDMVQNHLLQILLLLTMDAPLSFQAEDLRRAKAAVLDKIHVEEAFFGQYRGYRQEPGIAADSLTPTYAEIRLSLDTPRWQGVPLFIRTGKALGRSGTEAAVTFRQDPPVSVPCGGCPNRLVFTLQPGPGIILDMLTKVPGEGMSLHPSRMNFCLSGTPQGQGDRPSQPLPDAYGRLLQDALRGDKTLFVSGAENQQAWEKTAPLLEPLSEEPYLYNPGSSPRGLKSLPSIDFSDYALLCPLP